MRVKFDNPPRAFRDWEIEPGCCVDGARGIYAIDGIVALAEGYGFIPSPCECDVCKGTAESPTALESNYGGCEFANELEDEIGAFMNDKFAVSGHYWGRNENGDYGLWAHEDSVDEESR
jgi:hypothetical protein